MPLVLEGCHQKLVCYQRYRFRLHALWRDKTFQDFTAGCAPQAADACIFRSMLVLVFVYYGSCNRPKI